MYEVAIILFDSPDSLLQYQADRNTPAQNATLNAVQEAVDRASRNLAANLGISVEEARELLRPRSRS